MKKINIAKYTLLATALLALLLLGSCEHEHSFGAPTILKAPTCTEEGLQEVVCECGVIVESEIPVIDHVAGEWETVREATCISTGAKHHICQGCGVVLESEKIPALGHDMVKTPAKEPTCSETGYTEHETCTRCGLSNISEIKKLPHTPGAAPDCVNAQRCTVCGEIIKEAKGHTPLVIPGIEATCSRTGLTDRVECTECLAVIEEQIEIPEREHTLEIVPLLEPTCVRKGHTEGQKCAVCDEELIKTIPIPVINHVYSDEKSAKCEVCGDVRILGCAHTESTTIGNVSASCIKQGLTAGEICANTKCDWVLSSPEVLPATEHKPALKEGYAATDSKPGLTNGVYCFLCYTTLKAQTVIPVGDDTSPDIVTIESWTIGGEAESTVLKFNQQILENQNEKAYKITSTEKSTTTFDYGGKKSESAVKVYTFEKKNWTTESVGEGYTANLTFFDGVLYAETEQSDGTVVKKKMYSPSEEDIRACLGLDYSETVLMAFKKITFDTAENGNTTFECGKFKKDGISVLNNALREIEEMGKSSVNDSKTNGKLVTDKDSNILSQYTALCVNVKTQHLGELEVVRETTNVYEYGEYTVSAPEDPDSYETAKSITELFK